MNSLSVLEFILWHSLTWEQAAVEGRISQVSSHRVIVQLVERSVEGVVVRRLRTVPGLGELEELTP